MNVFTDKEVKRLFICVTIVCLIVILFGQVIVYFISNYFKQQLIYHDYEIAGSLAEKADTDLIIKAFISEKNSNLFVNGQRLLESSGYNTSLNNSLLPHVNNFHIRYSIIIFIFLVLISLIILGLLFINFKRRESEFESATNDVMSFLGGKTGIRLPDQEEGGLSKLFSSINIMSTSLNTHINKEKQHRKFLKNTVSDISHQLKTPLAALKMYNEIILEEYLDNEVVKKFTLKSQNEINRMENLILNLLKLAKLDAGTIILEKENVNLHNFLTNVVNRFQTRAESENKKINLPCENSIFLYCDPEWMTEAVSNIVKNALDHLPEEGTIEISSCETPLAVKISVKDNGTGIHPDDLNNVFKRFYRSRFSKDKQGIGIGLTISRSIVEKHGGQISVDSEMGEGSLFTMVFPKLTNM